MNDPMTNDMPALGTWRMPAEWEPHQATWLAWPKNASDWPGKFAPIRWVYGEIIRKIVAGERVRLLVDDRAAERQARRVLTRIGVDLSRIDFLNIPTNRGWTRDCGPAFIKPVRPAGQADGSASAPAVVRFSFNGWARYPDHELDALVHESAARALDRPLVRARHKGRDVVLEGGSIDVNGHGAILTTEECLLDETRQTRNPGFTRADYEEVFKRYLGAGNTIWLGHGIQGDDTHGHVDDLCRFTGPRTIVLCREDDPKDANYRALEENRERLEGARLEDGSRPEVVHLPMPSPLVFDSLRLPASYANFYIANACVIVPTFNDVNDRTALGILSELFSDRPVVGIHAVDLVWGLGTLHCLSHEEPA